MAIWASEQNGDPITAPNTLYIMRNRVPRREFCLGGIKEKIAQRTMRVLSISIRSPTPDHGIHMVFFVRVHVMIEIVHELFALHSLVAPIANLSGEEFDYPSEW